MLLGGGGGGEEFWCHLWRGTEIERPGTRVEVCIASADVTYLKLILKSSDSLPGTILPRLPMFV